PNVASTRSPPWPGFEPHGTEVLASTGGRAVPIDATPPTVRNADAASTAPDTASDVSAPPASSAVAVAANRSPAPHGSHAPTGGAGTTSGGPAVDATNAPRSPRVTA